MITSNVQIKYAQALLKVADRLQVAENVLQNLKALADLLKNKKLAELLVKISFTSNEAKTKVIEATFQGKVHELVLNLLKILALRKRLNLIPKIYEIYRRIYHEAKGMTEITVRAARALTPAEEQKLTAKLLQKNTLATVQFEHKPELIGGVQLYEDGYLTDYSVQNYLQTLQHHLLSQTTPFEN